MNSAAVVYLDQSSPNADTYQTDRPRLDPFAGSESIVDPEIASAADCILDDCLFSMGQVVGMRTTIDYDAIIWLRDWYRPRFIRVLQRFGMRWLEDRSNVTAVAFMLGERAVRYAADRKSIDIESVRCAAADTARYCALHSKRRARALGLHTSGADQPWIAGYWCTF
jgi:hypothetical protein